MPEKAAEQGLRLIFLLLGTEYCAQGVYTPHLWLAQHQSTTYGGFSQYTGEIGAFTEPHFFQEKCYKMNISSMKPGLYLYKIYRGNLISMGKFIIAK